MRTATETDRRRGHRLGRRRRGEALFGTDGLRRLRHHRSALEPRSFSFNSAYGACKRCHGLGTKIEVDPAKIIIDDSIPIGEMRFVGDADKATDAYLREARCWPSRDISARALEMTFANFPRKRATRSSSALKEKIEFRYGDYSYKADWKGATTLLRDAMNRREPEEEVVAALEALVSPITCRACDGATLAAGIAGREDQRALDRRLHGDADRRSARARSTEVKLTPREEHHRRTDFERDPRPSEFPRNRSDWAI